MRRIMLSFFMVIVLLAPSVVFAEADYTNDTVFDKAADWFATAGKSPEEKDRILFERRTERAAKKLQKDFNRGAKQAGKNMDKLGKDLEKAFK